MRPGQTRYGAGIAGGGVDGVGLYQQKMDSGAILHGLRAFTDAVCEPIMYYETGGFTNRPSVADEPHH